MSELVEQAETAAFNSIAAHMKEFKELWVENPTTLGAYYCPELGISIMAVENDEHPEIEELGSYPSFEFEFCDALGNPTGATVFSMFEDANEVETETWNELLSAYHDIRRYHEEAGLLDKLEKLSATIVDKLRSKDPLYC
jgi:hypothetical protein